MCRNPARNLVDGLLDLGAFNMRLGVMITNAMFPKLTDREKEAAESPDGSTAVVGPSVQVSELDIEAATLVLEQRLVEGYELGFQAILRLNFPRDRLREIAREALFAVRRISTHGAV